MSAPSAALCAQMIALRRDLHRHPELAWGERESAERVRVAVRDLGLEVRTLAGTGLVAELPGQQPGPFIALRADLDALPVHEATGLEFSSIRPGVMHACGHDAHSAMLFGAAALLLERPPPLPVRLLWQPAEETGTGAQVLVEHGVLDGVAAIFGGHVDNRYPAGMLVVSEGAVNASTDGFRITLEGRGGHGARPHEAVDAVLAAAALVGALQTIVSREVDPAEPAVLSVGSLRAGQAMNVIAETAALEGTLRALTPAVRERLRRSLVRVAEGVGATYGCQVQVAMLSGTPAVINTPDMTALAREAALLARGQSQVTPMVGVNLGGEDFGWYLERVPGAFVRFGAGRPGQRMAAAHSSRFDLDEGCLSAGAAWMAAVARLAGERIAQAPAGIGYRIGSPHPP